jgi:hypothetical protein
MKYTHVRSVKCMYISVILILKLKSLLLVSMWGSQISLWFPNILIYFFYIFRGINFALSNNFPIGLFRQCDIICFGTIQTVWYHLFWNYSDSVISFVLELFRQCDIICFGTIQTVWYHLLWNYSDSVILFVFHVINDIIWLYLYQYQIICY